jgi:hypothetical protein
MEVSSQLHVPTVIPLGKSARYRLDRRLGGSQSRSGRCAEEKKVCAAGNRTRAVESVARQRYPGSQPQCISILWVVCDAGNTTPPKAGSILIWNNIGDTRLSVKA